jgi:putative ABC transport system substrate-binding protein
MRRREFIAGIAAVTAWPAHAQQPTRRLRRIGVLMGWTNAGANRANFEAFVDRLVQLDWVEGRNVHVEPRWTDANLERAQALAKELVSQQPDVLFSATTPATVALFRETRELPIVFAIVSDPIGAGLVASLARPGGNITGFINEEAAMGGKWLQLIKQVAPGIKRAAIMFNPDTAPGGGGYFLGSFQATARSLALEAATLQVRSNADIEAAIDSLGERQTGLVLIDSFVDTTALRSSKPRGAKVFRRFLTRALLPKMAA